MSAPSPAASAQATSCSCPVGMPLAHAMVSRLASGTGTVQAPHFSLSPTPALAQVQH